MEDKTTQTNQPSSNNPLGSTPPKKNNLDKLNKKAAILHTYKQDVESLVRKRKVSLVKALAMQSDKMPDGETVMSTSMPKNTSKKASFMLLASITMIILGIVAISAAYMAYTTKKQTLSQGKASVLMSDSLLFVEHRTRLNVTDRLPHETLADLTRILANSRATLGSITQVLLEKHEWNPAAKKDIARTIGQRELLSILGLSFSEQFIRMLGPDNNYMLGMHMADRNTPFLLITTNSYDYSFAEMLKWESRGERELNPLFSTPGVASSKRSIEDIVVQNIDARVIRDDERNLKLLYAFIDQHTLLITNNIYTLTEVARRYNIRKTSGLTVNP